MIELNIDKVAIEVIPKPEGMLRWSMPFSHL